MLKKALNIIQSIKMDSSPHLYINIRNDIPGSLSVCRVLPRKRLVPFAQKKNSRGRKKTQIDGPEGAPNFSDGKTTKSDFRNVVLAF